VKEADKVVLALDEGTTSCRSVVLGLDGTVLGVAQRAVGRSYPRPGWVEQDAREIWAAQKETATQALRSSQTAVSRVAAVGIANQRETTIVWDRATSRPIAPAVVWQDRRTAEHCETLREAGHDPLVRAKTGLVLDPYFSATKLAWILNHVPGARARAARGELAFGTVDSWLIWCMSGGRLHVTDATNASRTLLYDLSRGDWDDELLELFDVPRALLPEVRDSSGVVGETEAGLFGSVLPVAGVAGDQQAALFGQACTGAGMTKVTYGTGCFALTHTGDAPVRSNAGLLTTVALQRGGRRAYALEGSAFVAGAAVQWLRDGLGIIPDAAACDALAAQVESGEGVYFVPALAGLAAPYWQPRARGAIVGLTLGTTAAHIARATLEGIALQVGDLIDAIAADLGAGISEVRADGGAAASDQLLQLQASARLCRIPEWIVGSCCAAGGRRSPAFASWPDARSDRGGFSLCTGPRAPVLSSAAEARVLCSVAAWP
jgi:glycerol kinase